MEWMEIIGKTIQYIEDHITEDITVVDIAKNVNLSSFFIQKGFAMLCGITVSEYIRNRRLTLAGSELLISDVKVIDIAAKYGYDSPDSFTKAFARFHGVTPMAVRKDGVMLKNFAPLKLRISLEGGYHMDYKIVKKEAFTVVAKQKTFSGDIKSEDYFRFWREHYSDSDNSRIIGNFGISIENENDKNVIEYLIANLYDPQKEIPLGMVTKIIPAFEWAVFPCRGSMPGALEEVYAAVFKEWLPIFNEYDVVSGCCIEYYDDFDKYPNGAMSDDYYCELWIPIKSKHHK